MSGKLYVFEGPDGSGKTELCGQLADVLRARGDVVHLLAFPGQNDGTLGRHVYRVHHEPAAFSIRSITPSSLQALHIAAHLDTIETTILPALNRGEHVVLDRFWWSTLVYGRVAGVNSGVLDALIEAESISWGHQVPDLLFFIKRESPLRDEPRERWELLQGAYRSLLMAESGKYPICVIENESSVETALNAVVHEVSCLLPSGDV